MEVSGHLLGNPEPRLATKADFTWLRPIIEQEYKHAGKTRQQVCEMLLTQYGIKITENVFKKRISSWQLDKKKKRNEMVYAVKKISGRKVTGKATAVVIRGEAVTQDVISHYSKRRPLKTIEQHQPFEDKLTPTEMVLSTPRCQASILVAAEQAVAPLGLNGSVQSEATDVEYDFFSQQALLSLNETIHHSPSLDKFLDQETQPALRTLNYSPQPGEISCVGCIMTHRSIGQKKTFGYGTRSSRRFSSYFRESRELTNVRRQNEVSERIRRHLKPSHPDDVAVDDWKCLAITIAWSIDEAVAAGQKDYVLNLLYYHISDQLGPTHPAVYLLSSAACASGRISLLHLVVSTLPIRYHGWKIIILPPSLYAGTGLRHQAWLCSKYRLFRVPSPTEDWPSTICYGI